MQYSKSPIPYLALLVMVLFGTPLAEYKVQQFERVLVTIEHPTEQAPPVQVALQKPEDQAPESIPLFTSK